ncbi:hypothetical protein ABW636_07960 [Aquimarina sp. 2201CG1-2-11]|uniref:hypothetical protein n=1 Tax=Aquimarina discodermiae TaxID=3231043 RepID=UPI0034619400
MKKLTYFLFLLSTLAISQNNGFIEVEVRDSIRIDPISFIYEISIDDSKFLRYEEDGTRNDIEARKKLNEKYVELGSFLKSGGYQTKNLNKQNYELHSYVGFLKLGYAVKLKSAEELDKLLTELKKLDFVRASIGEFELPEESVSNKRLFKKLMEKAFSKAKTIAELSKLKLGRIVEFKEVREIDNISFNLMDIYVKSQEKRTIGNTNGTLYALSWKAAVIKFVVE